MGLWARGGAVGVPVHCSEWDHVALSGPLQLKRFCAPMTGQPALGATALPVADTVDVSFPINSPSTFMLKQCSYDLISFTNTVMVRMQQIRFT